MGREGGEGGRGGRVPLLLSHRNTVVVCNVSPPSRLRPGRHPSLFSHPKRQPYRTAGRADAQRLPHRRLGVPSGLHPFAISLLRLVLRSLRLDRSLGGWNVIYAYHTHTWKSVFAVLGTHMRLGMNPSTLPTSVFRSMKPR